MCIAILSTAHPKYALILLSNRDEYLNRPTAPASWWSGPNEHVLGGRDLQREVQGTWLGITRQGRLAVLTNYREDDQVAVGPRSRGEIPNAFLSTSPDSQEPPASFAGKFVKEDSLRNVGGFSLLFGQLKKPQRGHQIGPLGIVSNRTPDADAVVWILGNHGDSTVALSNSHFGDRNWPKVVDGEDLLKDAIEGSTQLGEGHEEFIARCFKVLSTDKLPKRVGDQEWMVYIKELRKSIFIPPIGGSDMEFEKPADEVAAAKEGTAVASGDGFYGTQKQTIVLVDYQGRVTFIERTLVDEKAQPTDVRHRDRRFEFDIEGWDDYT